MDQQGRESRALEWDFEVLDPWPCDELRRLSKAVHTAPVCFESFRFRLQKSFAYMIVVRSPAEIASRRGVSPCGQMRPALFLEIFGFARPFPKPSLVVANMIAQPQANTMHLADFSTTPWGGVEADQDAM